MKTPICSGSALRTPEPDSLLAGDASESPERRSSATSGFYVRADRPNPDQGEEHTRGERLRRAQCVTRLWSLVRTGEWRADSTTTACGIVCDGWLSAEEEPAAAPAQQAAEPPRSVRGGAR